MPHSENCVPIHLVSDEDFGIHLNSMDPEHVCFVTLADGRTGLIDWDFGDVHVVDQKLSHVA